MSIVGFYLDQYRFDKIEASSPSDEPSANQLIEMRFEVGFHDDDQPGNQFSVTLKLVLAARHNDERERLLNIAARGDFLFAKGEEPHPVKEPFERLYAATLLYGALRPTLDSIVANIGLRGLALPLNIPFDKEGRLPETPAP